MARKPKAKSVHKQVTFTGTLTLELLHLPSDVRMLSVTDEWNHVIWGFKSADGKFNVELKRQQFDTFQVAKEQYERFADHGTEMREKRDGNWVVKEGVSNAKSTSE